MCCGPHSFAGCVLACTQMYDYFSVFLFSPVCNCSPLYFMVSSVFVFVSFFLISAILTSLCWSWFHSYFAFLSALCPSSLLALFIFLCFVCLGRDVLSSLLYLLFLFCNFHVFHLSLFNSPCIIVLPILPLQFVHNPGLLLNFFIVTQFSFTP